MTLINAGELERRLSPTCTAEQIMHLEIAAEDLLEAFVRGAAGRPRHALKVATLLNRLFRSADPKFPPYLANPPAKPSAAAPHSDATPQT